MLRLCAKLGIPCDKISVLVVKLSVKIRIPVSVKFKIRHTLYVKRGKWGERKVLFTLGNYAKVVSSYAVFYISLKRLGRLACYVYCNGVALVKESECDFRVEALCVIVKRLVSAVVVNA